MLPRTYRFGEFELNEALFELRRGGVRVELQPKAVDLLLYLVRHRDRVVPRDELFAALWREVAVSEASLDKAVSAARRAIGDSGGAQSRIETVRSRGFRFVAAVEENEGATDFSAQGAPPIAAAPSLDGDFVGRRDVLDAIAEAIADAGRGAGRLILLSGEAGMGKTRTAQEAAARFREGGGRVLLSWCTEREGMPSLWPWLHLLRQLAAEGDPRSLTDGLLEGAADLAELIPFLRGRLPNLPPSPVDPEQARFRLFDTIAEILRRSCAERPHLLVLDDFHWADGASLALLDFLSRETFASRLAVLVSYREEDLRAGHLLLELPRRPGCEARGLTGLDRPEVARLIESELGAPAGPAFVEAVHHRTEGNPFFVKELVRALAARGPTDGASSVAGLSPLPAGIHEVLRQRLDRLSPACAELLAVAAVMGRDFDVDVIAEVAGLARVDLLERLDEAAAARLIRGAGTRRSFAHALVRDVLLERTPTAERSAFHHRLAEVLEARHRDDLDPFVAELAHHFCAGALTGDAERAVAYARRAGDRAARMLAADEAAVHYQRALEVQGSHGAADERLRCELLLALGEVQMFSGRGQEGRATLRQAADLARRLDAAELLGRAALASGGLEFSTDPGIHDPDLIALLEEGLAALPEGDSTLRVRLLARLAIALCWVPAFERSAVLIGEAVAAARRLGDPAAVAHALYIHRWSLIGPADLEARLADSEEMLALATKAQERVLELAARSCRFLDLVELGRLNEADRELAAYERLAAELRVPRYRWRARFYRAMRAQLEGRFAAAEETALEALADGRRLQLEDAVNVFGVQLLTLRLEQGRVAEIEATLRSFVDRSPAVPAWGGALPLLHAEMGRQAEARDCFEGFAIDAFETLPRDVFWLPAMVFLGEAACLLEDGPRAATLYELLRPFAPRTVVIGVGVVCWGALDRFLGSLATTAGRWDDAARHLETALRMNTRIGARPWIGWTHYDLARLMTRSGDREQARTHLARAGEIAESAGMGRLAERVAALSPQLA